MSVEERAVGASARLAAHVAGARYEDLPSPVVHAFKRALLDDECERIYPGRRSGVVEIGLTDGRKLTARVLDPKGEGENPMSDGDLERKFTANCAPVIGRARCDTVLQSIWHFEEAPDPGKLLCLLSGMNRDS